MPLKRALYLKIKHARKDWLSKVPVTILLRGLLQCLRFLLGRCCHFVNDSTFSLTQSTCYVVTLSNNCFLPTNPTRVYNSPKTTSNSVMNNQLYLLLLLEALHYCMVHISFLAREKIYKYHSGTREHKKLFRTVRGLGLFKLSTQSHLYG